MSFHDWQATMMRWLFMPFSQDFLVLPIKKSDKSVKYESDNSVSNIESHVGKSGFASHTKHTAEATNTDLLHSWEITCNLEFQNKEQKAYLDAVKFKTKT